MQDGGGFVTSARVMRDMLASLLAGVLLIGCAAALAFELPIRIFEQVHTLTGQSLREETLGNPSLALKNITAAQRLVAENEHLFSQLEKQQLADIAQQLSKPSLTDASATPHPSYERMLKSLDPQAKARQFHVAPILRAPTVAETLARTFNFVPRIVIVSAAVKKFSEAFRRGARDPTAYFQTEKQLAKLMGLNVSLIDRWTAAPEDKRIFITGARSDEPYARILSERYGREGYVPYFYQDCKPLCLESTVGAFFGSAGEVIHVDSTDASKSDFIPVELGLISELRSGGRRMLVIKRSEFGDVETLGTMLIAATLLECAKEAVQFKDVSCHLLNE